MEIVRFSPSAPGPLLLSVSSPPTSHTSAKPIFVCALSPRSMLPSLNYLYRHILRAVKICVLEVHLQWHAHFYPPEDTDPGNSLILDQVYLRALVASHFPE